MLCVEWLVVRRVVGACGCGLTVGLLESCTGRSTSELLGFPTTGIGHQQRSVVRHQNVLNLLLTRLVHVYHTTTRQHTQNIGEITHWDRQSSEKEEERRWDGRGAEALLGSTAKGKEQLGGGRRRGGVWSGGAED